MAPRSRILAFAISILCLVGAVTSADPVFPSLDEIEIAAYTTEVQVTDVIQQYTSYAIELYDVIEKAGKLETFLEGEIRHVYFSNYSYEILEVNSTRCMAWQADESIYGLEAIFPRWLHKDPLVIGPSAPLYYAQENRDDVVFESTEIVRGIPCEKFALDIRTKDENFTVYYYFAPSYWTTPYKENNIRVAIRIRVIGQTSKDVEGGRWIDVDVISDFAFFKPYIRQGADIQPPVGLGCMLRKKSDSFPDFPEKFQYEAELVDLGFAAEHDEIDVKFEKVWYDKNNRIGRFDIFKRTTSSSSFQDYDTGVMFEFTKEQDCQLKPMRNTFFGAYDSNWAARFKEPKEVLHLDGEFYDMGQRDVRGLRCDTFESVQYDVFFKEKLHRFVVTAYFIEDSTVAAVNSESVSRIPVLVMLTGWRSATEIAFKLQYNVFDFTDVVWPEMYADFNIDKCYTKTDTKTQFVLILLAKKKDAALMEEQNEMVIKELRIQIANLANVPEWRIPFLKVDYTENNIYANGLMLERPPALPRFELFFSDDIITKDKYLRVSYAGTLDDCAEACVDRGDDCTGFYFCSGTCFLKGEYPTDTHTDDDKAVDLGSCDEYLRDVRGTSENRDTRLKDALERLEGAVLNKSIEVVFRIPNGEEVIKVADIIVGDGPFIGVDTGDKPYSSNIKFRRIDASLMTSTVHNDVELLHDCYKKCQNAGSGCASFSYCGRKTVKKNKSDQPKCVVSSQLHVRGKTSDLDLVEDEDCDIFDLNYLEFFTKYPEQVSFLSGYQDIRNVDTAEECAMKCRFDGKTDKDDKQKCRGFEYCSSMKTCSLHEKHILDLKPGETGTPEKNNRCTHYAARFIADYANLGTTLLEDSSNIRYQLTLEECARICSEELGDSCKSFNFCPTSKTSCELSGKVINSEGVTIISREPCIHYEKRNSVQDWSSDLKLLKSGYTKKGFTGLVVGMLALGLIIGALGFVAYSYVRSRKYGEGMSVRFMKQQDAA